jgi:hypothetical protein
VREVPRFAPDRSEFDKCQCATLDEDDHGVCEPCLEYNRAHDEWADAKFAFEAAEEARGDYLRDQMKDDDIERGGR